MSFSPVPKTIGGGGVGLGNTETDLAWSSSLEDVRIMVRHEACPPGGNLVLMCAVVSNSASAVP